MMLLFYCKTFNRYNRFQILKNLSKIFQGFKTENIYFSIKCMTNVCNVLTSEIFKDY